MDINEKFRMDSSVGKKYEKFRFNKKRGNNEM